MKAKSCFYCGEPESHAVDCMGANMPSTGEKCLTPMEEKASRLKRLADADKLNTGEPVKTAEGEPKVCNETPVDFCREVGHEPHLICTNCGTYCGSMLMPPVNRHVYNKYKEGRRAGRSEGQASRDAVITKLQDKCLEHMTEKDQLEAKLKVAVEIIQKMAWHKDFQAHIGYLSVSKKVECECPACIGRNFLDATLSEVDGGNGNGTR